jgi:hypothetical protein
MPDRATNMRPPGPAGGRGRTVFLRGTLGWEFQFRANVETFLEKETGRTGGLL